MKRNNNIVIKFLLVLWVLCSQLYVASKQSMQRYNEEKIPVADYHMYKQNDFIEVVTKKENYKVLNNDVSLLSANMVNYHVDTREIAYENFNMNSYPIRDLSKKIYKESDYINKDVQQIGKNEKTLKTESYVPSEELDISKCSILGEDERVKVDSPKSWPYCGVVLIKAYFNNLIGNDGEIYYVVSSGTGFMEGLDLMVTAAHVMYNDVTSEGVLDDRINNPRFPDTIQVFAGINGEKEKLEAQYLYYAEVDIVNIQKEYYLNPSFDYDWAACQLDRNLGGQTGYYGKISNWYVKGAEVYSYGYPGDKYYTMWETHGKTIDQTSLRIDYNFDSVGGQSGSPVFMIADDGSVYVCAIHTSGGNSTNGGTKINSFIFHYLNSFVTNYNYDCFAATISPSDYGFEDAYPTDEATRLQYKTHILPSGFKFQTRRYRTGYIHNEFIVMSPIRKGIKEAFIEYKFDYPVSKIEVDLTHWRSLTKEKTYRYNCTAVLRTSDIDGHNTIFDILSKETNLPLCREYPKTYSIEFPKPIFSFEFYMESKYISTSDTNRGRICIGNMNIYTASRYL